MKYDIFGFMCHVNMVFYDIIFNKICYVISCLYLICEKKNNMKYILFSMFKIKIISLSYIFYLKN